MKIAVVGTGFSSLLCIQHLVEHGLKPIVIDVGKEVDEEKTNTLKRYSLSKQKNLDDFLYFGGLSNVWSGLIEKYHQNELNTWPIKNGSLEYFYDEVLKKINNSSICSFSSNYEKNVLDYKAIVTDKINKEKIFFKQNLSIKYSSILANKINDDQIKNFSHKKISPYSTKKYISVLIKNSKIEYKKEKVIKLGELNNKVLIETISNFNTHNSIEVDYLFLGSGPISTYKIMKNSIPDLDKDISIKTTKQFVLPVKLSNLTDFSSKFYNTLPIFQLNIESHEKYSLYSQIYNLNPNIINFFLPKIKNYQKYFFLFNFFKNFGFSYFNLGSAYTDKFIINDNSEIELTEFKYKIKDVLKGCDLIFDRDNFKNELLHYKFPIKMKPLSGNHFGSTFPMSFNDKKKFSSDIYGRVGVFKHISITDSSTFPFLSARPPTYTILANSLRIVTEVSKMNFFRS